MTAADAPVATTHQRWKPLLVLSITEKLQHHTQPLCGQLPLLAALESVW